MVCIFIFHCVTVQAENSLFTVLFAYVVFLLVLWLGICVEVDVAKTIILPPSPLPYPSSLPPYSFFPYPRFSL